VGKELKQLECGSSDCQKIKQEIVWLKLGRYDQQV